MMLSDHVTYPPSRHSMPQPTLINSSVMQPSCRIRKQRFLPRDAMLVQYMLSSCVCLSVCLYVTSQHCTKTAKCRISQTTPYDRHCFLCSKMSIDVLVSCHTVTSQDMIGSVLVSCHTVTSQDVIGSVLVSCHTVTSQDVIGSVTVYSVQHWSS